VEHAPQVLLGFLHTAHLVYEVHVPGGPPEPAVGDRAQADVLLHPDRVANRVVGADHVCVYVFGGGDEALPLDAWRRLAPALTSL
jgi:hypothetical protein